MAEPVAQFDVVLRNVTEGGGPNWPDLVGHLIWPLLILAILAAFRAEIQRLLRTFSDRVRAGSALKLGAFEVGALNVRHVDLSKPNAHAHKDNGTRAAERDAYYAASRHLLLVHRLARSRTTGQEFDILVYLVPHEDQGTLAIVERVEYFIGKFWHHIIYTSTNRHAAFPIRLSAYGPTLCTAKVHFTDGESTILHRYLDFEMGACAPLLAEDDDS